MDWLNEFPEATGIDRIIATGAQRLMRGKITFRSPYWEGDVVLETLDGYRAWVRTIEMINSEQGTEKRAKEIWETELEILQRAEYEFSLE